MNGESRYRIVAGNAVGLITVIRTDIVVKIQVGLNKIKLRELPWAFNLFLHKFIEVDIKPAARIVFDAFNNSLIDR